MNQIQFAEAKQSHNHCLMCGNTNPLSFGLTFQQHSDNSVSTRFRGNSGLQGYSGILHGGVLSSLLDTAMANCLLLLNIKAMTGELKIRFLQPVKYDSVLSIKAWLTASLPPLYHLKSEIHVDGTLVCRASARFMEKEENDLPV